MNERHRAIKFPSPPEFDLDPERALWVPGRKKIFLPTPKIETTSWDIETVFEGIYYRPQLSYENLRALQKGFASASLLAPSTSVSHGRTENEKSKPGTTSGGVNFLNSEPLLDIGGRMRTIAIDSQILNTLVACGRKVKMQFIDNWRPTEKAEALEKGDLMHKMLAYYLRGKKAGMTKNDQDHAVLIAGAIAEGRKEYLPMQLSVTTAEEDIRQFKENVLYWQRDGWKILEVEQSFSKVLYERPDTPTRPGLRILYEGIIDALVEHPSPHGIYIVDHKTGSRRSNPNKLSNQFMGYCWAFDMNQVIINKIGFQTTLSASERFQRQFITYERELLKEWVQQAVYWTHQLVNYIDQNYFPPNFTSCDKYSGCIFQQVCCTIPQVRQFKLDSGYYQGDPWSPHTRDKKEENLEGEA